MKDEALKASMRTAQREFIPKDAAEKTYQLLRELSAPENIFSEGTL